MAARAKPKLAVWKFSSCDGCQLTLLDCEDELLAITEEVRISYFLEATRKAEKGPYDVSLVEGSITTPHDIKAIRDVRKNSKVLVSIGACSTAGGIQALRNFASVKDYSRAVYAHPEYLDTLTTSTAISDHVRVDFELRGCPINKHQLLEVLGAFLNGRKPNIPQYSECVECKRNGIVCRMVAKGTPCLGPATQAGCGTLCPGTDRGCYGCFGPAEGANTAALAARLAHLGKDDGEIGRLFRTFNANAEAFRKESQSHG
ncbi:MAG: oxidoreductase [Magnetospirillum sp.]|nr:oxidoreductase [Magnetospirillum sp.]